MVTNYLGMIMDTESNEVGSRVGSSPVISDSLSLLRHTDPNRKTLKYARLLFIATTR